MKINHFLPTASAFAALLLISGAAKAQPPQLPEPLYAQGFEEGAGTWTGMGAGASVSLETAPENIKQGAGALRFRYQVATGQMNLLVSPFAPRSLDTLQSISFWLKADHNTCIAFALQEQGGGRFGTFFSLVEDKWQLVEIAPSELLLQEGEDDPKDADGKLNLEKVEAAALLDFGQLFAQLATDMNSPLVRMLGIETGPRALVLDDFKFSSKPPSPAPATPEPPIIDDFARPQASWISVGDAELQVVRPTPEETDKVPALQVDYTQINGRVVAWGKMLSPGVLAGKTSLSFDLLSKRGATMIVQLEEKSGGKYNATFAVPGGDAPVSKTLSLADFKRSDDSKDINNRLDLKEVKQLLVLDASGLIGTGAGDNTLQLSKLRVN